MYLFIYFYFGLKLGKLRFVNVSEFKGKPYVNIREYYESNGKTLPGKKGKYFKFFRFKLVGIKCKFHNFRNLAPS